MEYYQTRRELSIYAVFALRTKTRLETIDPKSAFAGAGAAGLFCVGLILPIQVWRTLGLTPLGWGGFLPVYTGLVCVGLGLLAGVKLTSALLLRDWIVGFMLPLVLGVGLVITELHFLGGAI